MSEKSKEEEQKELKSYLNSVAKRKNKSQELGSTLKKY